MGISNSKHIHSTSLSDGSCGGVIWMFKHIAEVRLFTDSFDDRCFLLLRTDINLATGSQGNN